MSNSIAYTAKSADLEDEIYSLFSDMISNSHKVCGCDYSQLFSKTKRILEIYRICVWNLNFAANDIKQDLEFIAGGSAATSVQSSKSSGKQCNLFSVLLDAAEQKGFDIYQTWIPGRVHSISKSAALLDFTVRVLDVVRSYPYGGEKYYRLLYLTYFDTEHTSLTGVNVRTMRLMGYSNQPAYYKHKKEAIALYSAVFWDLIDDQLILSLISQ